LILFISLLLYSFFNILWHDDSKPELWSEKKHPLLGNSNLNRLPLLGNGSANTFPRQQRLPKQRRNCWRIDWLTAILLLALGSTVILGSEPHGTHDHTLPSDGSRSLQTTVL
jgi:hypothetical protein